MYNSLRLDQTYIIVNTFTWKYAKEQRLGFLFFNLDLI